MQEVSCKFKFLKALALSLGMLAGALPGLTAAAEVAPGRDLRQDGAAAERRALPILLSFTSTYCGYCTQLEESFLKPMLISGDYEDKVLIRKIVIDEHRTLIDFDGRAVDANRLAQRYEVRVVPTVILVDGQGRELAERLIGINTPEFYGGYLDQNIETARERLRDRQPARAVARSDLTLLPEAVSP